MKSGEKIPDELWDIIEDCLKPKSLRISMPKVSTLLSFFNYKKEDRPEVDGPKAIEYLLFRAKKLVRLD